LSAASIWAAISGNGISLGRLNAANTEGDIGCARLAGLFKFLSTSSQASVILTALKHF